MNVDNGSTDAGDKCGAVISYIRNVTGGVFPYNNMIFGYDWDAYEKATDDYFDSTKNPDWAAFLTAIHVDASTQVPVFSWGSSKVGEAFAPDQMIDYTSDFDTLINTYQSRVLVYVGEWDAQDGPATMEPWLRRINLGDDYDTFWNTGKQLYYVKEDASSSSYDWTGGYWR